MISLVIQTYRQHKNIRAMLDALDYPELERYQAICRSLLADSVYEENLVRGCEMTMETAIEFALEQANRSRIATSPPADIHRGAWFD